MSKLLISVLSIVLLALIRADDDLPLWSRELEPSSHLFEVLHRNADEQVYRLPENVIPLEYDIYIDLYFAERTDRPFSYDGREYIKIQAVEENVTQVVLHANVDKINAITLQSESGAVRLNNLEPYTLEPQYHFLKINLAQTLVVNENYTLFIDYTSTMNDGPMKRGIWKGFYIDESGLEKIYAATHFQPYNARQAFPCWDEPLFKSVFTLHLSRPTTYVGTFSNTGVESISLSGNRIQEDFLSTPKMSSYLVTFLVSETFQVIAQDTSFTPPIRIIGRSNTVGLGEHALKLTVGMTNHFDEYFQMPYETLHPHLLNDHISSPDWASAGTENWGMVSYRELHLIVHRNETIMTTEHYAATLVSHELAHKWFGNLITCYWWSNTWINEGFASYFGYISAHAVFPEYDLHEHFNSRYLQTSLAFDSGVGTVPMNYDVNTPAQVTGHFGTISYSKGAAFLRMTVDIITPDSFRKACRYFLEANSFEPTDQFDLYDAFKRAVDEDDSLASYSDFDFEEYYRVWVNEPGYPILEVEVNHDSGEIKLKQERFFLSATANPTGHLYPIPITYSTKSNENFENVRPVMIMAGETAELRKDAAEEWVIFNNLQHGHYRVNYDARTWELITEALLEEPESIHYLNRAQIVDDVFAFMRSGRMTYNYGFNIIRFLRHETNFHVWDPAISGYTWLRNRLRHLPDSQAEFDAFILSYMEHVIDDLGFDIGNDGETPTITLTRQAILHFACTLGHTKCIQESYDRFVDMKDNDQWIDPRLRRSVYVTGMREGDRSHYEFLLKRFRDSNFANDRLEMLRGLGAVSQPELLTNYLELSLTKEVRSHDKVNAFNYALLGNPEGAYTVLQFVKNNIDAIRVAYVEDAPPNPVHTALSNLATYLNEPELVEYEDWLRSTQTNSLQFNSAINAINSARTNINWGTANVDTILGAARDSASTVLTSATMLAVMTLIALLIYVMSVLMKLLVLSGLLTLVAADLPVSGDGNTRTDTVQDDSYELVYRVPEDVDPIHFEVEVTPYFETAPAGKDPFSFDGIVTIHMKAVKDDISTISIQENVREILEITLTTAGTTRRPIMLHNSSPYVRVRQYHFLRLNLANNVTLVNGEEYILRIRYIGNINETPLQRGVFRGNYKDNEGNVHWYAATHLQPVNSRQAFPSFDEPGFKSTFDIIINRPAHFGETFSNMPIKETIPNGDRVKEIFHRTPRMSAYLVTFHISEAFTVIADNNDSEKPYRILARPNAAGQGEYALEVGPPLTEWLEDYFGIEYYTMDDNIKNDQIASPYWASGATENWGLVTYREVRLLYQVNETNAVDKMSIGTITAHELAHKWFGNLITCRWWDNVWINEGFASYFEYFAMDGVDKTLELKDQFNIMYVQSALSADWGVNTRALQHTVNSPAQVTGHFSGISYSKGASLLLMLKHFVTEPTFKKALNYFLRDRSYEHAFPEDLYRAFALAVEEDNTIPELADITRFMRYWVDEPGYPVLNVNVDQSSGHVDLRQSRFFINPATEETEQVWPLPLTYTTANNPNFEDVGSSELLMQGRDYGFLQLVDPATEWIIFNVQQQNIYRVNYNTENWVLLAEALKQNLTVIHHLNRAQIVDDVFALMRSEKITYELGFQVLSFLKEDTSYYSWYPAITGFSWLRNRFLHLPDVLEDFNEIIFDYVDAVIDDLGYDVVPGEPLTRTLNRFYILTFACNAGHEGCITDAVERFTALKDNGTPVDPNLRRHVFCEGLRAGGYEEWKFLFDRRQASNNQGDEVAMLRSLGCTTNDQARQEYLNMILDDDIVKAQDRLNAFTFFMMGDRSNANVVLEYLKENIDAIRQGIVLQTWFNSLISNLAGYLDEDGLTDMETWLQENQNSIPEYSQGISGITQARANQAWGTANAEIVLEAAKASAAAVLPTVMLLLTTCIALMLK